MDISKILGSFLPPPGVRYGTLFSRTAKLIYGIVGFCGQQTGRKAVAFVQVAKLLSGDWPKAVPLKGLLHNDRYTQRVLDKLEGVKVGNPG